MKVLQKCLDKNNSPQVEALLVDQLVDDGILNRKDAISIETIKLVPGIFLPDFLEETDVGPIVEALYSQLDNRNREQVLTGLAVDFKLVCTQRRIVYAPRRTVRALRPTSEKLFPGAKVGLGQQ